jgi:universal stress protein A
VFRHLLVPLDLSTKNRPALETALRLAKGESAKVTLLHVVQTLAQLPAKEMRAFYDKLEADSRKKLGRHAAPFRKAGVPVIEEVMLADVVLEEIVRFVRARHVDLIVLTSHRITAPSFHDWGTLSYKLAIVAPCPVLLVK